MKCPLCDSNKNSRLINLDCGNLDNSLIYRNSKVVVCKKCGHVYNILSKKEISDLEKYYEKESATGNLNPIDGVSDRPGSNSVFAMMRYNKLYNFLLPYLRKKMKVLDAGCATGGFLDYLSNKKYQSLYGFDMSKKYIKEARKKGHLVKVSKTDKIPFQDKSMDFVLIDQTMEHITDPKRAVQEFYRVLREDGLLCISVPDASRYGKNSFFDFFWLLLREHIQHFDMYHLKMLAEKEGFKLISYSKYATPMMSSKMILPVLNLVFRKTSKDEKGKSITPKNLFDLEKQIKNYVKDSSKKLRQKRVKISRLIRSKEPVYVWGLGREFMYIYGPGKLRDANLLGLIDTNPYKQKNYLVDGKRIYGPSILSDAPARSSLIITAVAHTQKIYEAALNLGYKGKVVRLDER